MRSFSEIRDTIANIEGTNVDAVLARRVGVDPRLWGQWKKRGTISVEGLLPYCKRKGFTLDWLLTGREPEPGVSNPLTPDERELLDIYRAAGDRRLEVLGIVKGAVSVGTR